jgi:hypothetical protein
MAFFEMWPARSTPNFAPAGARRTTAKDFEYTLYPSLTIEVGASEEIALRGEFEGAARLNVEAVEGKFVKVDFVRDVVMQQLRVFRLTAKSQGATRIDALRPNTPLKDGEFRLSSSAAASLELVVTDKNAVADVPSSDVIGGFMEGISGYSSVSMKLLKVKFLAQAMLPAHAGELRLGIAFQKGVLQGLQDGLTSFAEALKGVGQFMTDAAFRDALAKRVADLIGPCTDVILLVQGRPQAYITALMGNGKAIGKVLGEELGKEAIAQIEKKSAAELSEWMGRLVGLVAFEIILQAVTELIGVGAVAVVSRIAGEGAGLFRRIVPRLRPLLRVLEDAKAMLASKLAARGVTAARTLDSGVIRLLQALRLESVSGITAAERASVEALDAAAWRRVTDYAATNRNPFSVKGKLAEEVFRKAASFRTIADEVAGAAAQRGIRRDAIRFVDATGRAPSATSAGSVGELTDGMFVAEHEGKLHILGVVESKSPSNLRELAAKGSEFLGQPEWDFERLRQVPTKVDGVWWEPRNVVVSRRSTIWYGVSPQGTALSDRQIIRIQQGLPGFSQVPNVVSDGVLNEIARRIVAQAAAP